jgi:hypothetical protein
MNPQNCYTQVAVFQGHSLYTLQDHFQFEGIRQITSNLILDQN